MCLIINIINADDVTKPVDKQDLEKIPDKETKEIPIAVESDPVKSGEKDDTINKNENENSDKSEEESDDEEDDDELSSKELSTLDQLLTILTNVVVGEFIFYLNKNLWNFILKLSFLAIITPDEPEPVKEAN